jgi:polysaccharide export outer membrane protein
MRYRFGNTITVICIAAQLFLLSNCEISGGGNRELNGIDFPVQNGALVPEATGGNYQTNIGDTVEIFVLEDSSFNGKYVIRPSGDIIIPKLGRVPAAGVSLKELETAVQRQLESTQLKKATVIADPVTRTGSADASNQAGVTVYVSGNVVKTGRQFVPSVAGGAVTAFQAVIHAGGFTNFANKKKSFLLRRNTYGGSQRIPLNFTAIEDGKTEDIPLQEGDMIVVPQKMFGL